MIANRLFSNCRNLIQKNASGFRKSGVPVRGKHVVAIPPRNKVPTSELVVGCVLMSFSILAVPAWVLYYLPEYQGEDRNQYTGK